MNGKSLMKPHWREKDDFYSKLNMDDIIDADYMHAKRDLNDFEINNLAQYYDLYLTSDTLLLAYVFENFRKMCLKIYQLGLAETFSAPGLACQAVFKKTKVELELLTDIDILSMVEKGIRGRIFHSINRYVKANNKYMTDYVENKKSPYHKY